MNTLKNDRIETIVLAAPQEAQTIQNELNKIETGKYQVTAIYQDMAEKTTFDDILASYATLVIVSENSVQNFTTSQLHKIVHTPGRSVRVVAAIVSPVGEIFDASIHTGAACWKWPIRAKIFDELDGIYPDLLAEANERAVVAAETPDAPPEPEAPVRFVSLPGQIRQSLQTITIWSSKGGDGKSLLASELAYTLANVSGRRVLLVDADMGRGYIAAALGSDAHNFGRNSNISTMAMIYHNKKVLPKISDNVYNYPPAFGKGESNLDILFGLGDNSHSSLPCFTAENGQVASNFIANLIERAYADYEFVIFDIGTVITMPIHSSAIKYASTLLVISSPIVPAIQPTKAGLDIMRQKNLLGDRNMFLVINKWTKDTGLDKSDFAQYLGSTLIATIPAMDIGMMHATINDGRFFMETFLTGTEKESAEIEPLAQQMIALAENFSPGTRAQVEKNVPRLAKSAKKGRMGLFGKKGKGDRSK